MKWFQLDADFHRRPAIRAIFAKHQHIGTNLVIYAWSQIAARLGDGDASCRLYEPVELLAADTATPPDKVAAILHMGCDLEYEIINGRPLYVFDREAAAPHRFGATLMFFKMDNATRNKEWAQKMRSEFQRWEYNTPLASPLQGTCKSVALHTDLNTDRQTDLPGVAAPPEVAGTPGPDCEWILKDHDRGQHKGKFHYGCAKCDALKAQRAG